MLKHRKGKGIGAEGPLERGIFLRIFYKIIFLILGSTLKKINFVCRKWA